MKNIIKLFCFISLLLNCACEGEIDPLQFAPEGELRYPGKANNAIYFAGKERLQIQFTLSPDPNVNKAIVYWNLLKDSTSIDIDKNTLTDNIVNILIDNLPENIYNFEIYTYDKFNNQSVPTHLTGRTYGLRYSSALNSRSITGYEAANDNGDIKIMWGDSILASAGIQLTYTDLEQNKKVVEVPNVENETVLKAINITKEIEISTLFVPEANAIDTFVSKNTIILDPTKLILEMQKPYASGYVDGFDSPNNNKWDKLWDGKWGKTFNQNDNGTPWGGESGWGSFEPKGPLPAQPAWLTIDLSQPVKVARYRSGLYWPYMRACPKKTELWAYTGTGTPTAEEGWDNWIKIGSTDNSAYTTADMAREYPLGDNIYTEYASVPSARFYRIKVSEIWGTNDIFSISEVTFWKYSN
ncbi:MAG: hypothetical protein PARBA_01701 [Parabacteroides sp.]